MRGGYDPGRLIASRETGAYRSNGECVRGRGVGPSPIRSQATAHSRAIALKAKKGFDGARLVVAGRSFGRRPMKALTFAGLGLAVLIAGASAASAKTLVYCSEGSPENFTPAINTTGTSFDAARPVYTRLTEFKRGTTDIVPGLAESWDIADGGKTITFHLRKGVKFHPYKDFKPTRDFNADDVLFSFDRQWKPENPYYKVSGGKYDYFNDMDMPKLLDSLEKRTMTPLS
jgi:ABC-type transport system substrate-binding protein